MNAPQKDENEGEKNESQQFLKKKRKPKFTLEEILTLYCKQNNIEDNEIQEKIKSIYYFNPEQNMLIDYQKSRGDKFPLSRHINKNPIPNNINLDEEEEDQEQEQEKNGEEKKDENERNNKNKKEEEEREEDTLVECFICGWKFLKQMDLQEKNTHINMCLEGKGEENKKEIISTYKEIENLKNRDEQQNNNNNNAEGEANRNNGENDDNNNNDE